MNDSDQQSVEGGIPVEDIAGVILKLQNGVIIDVVGVSNAPERAAVIADEMKAKDSAFDYQMKAVKVYPEHAI
jgi:hypothetical protein